MNKKIVICANSSWNLKNFRTGLISALVDSGYEVVALAPRDASTAAVEALGCRFIELPMNPTGTGVLSNLNVWFSFLRILRLEKPDCFLGFTIKPNILGSLAARILNITYINNITGLGSVFGKRTLLTHLATILYSFALAKSSCVFFQNPDDRLLFSESGILKGVRTDLLPGSGINLDIFQSQKSEQNEVLDDIDENIVFILISRMLRNKGVVNYYKAARQLRSAGVRAEFRLLGPIGSGRNSVPWAEIQRWNDEGIINYLGETQDVRQFLLSVDCVVLPTYYREGVPRALIEGAATGLPLIATDVAGCREIVIAQKNGFLCKPDCADDLAEKMKLFASLDYKSKVQMGKFSREIAETLFDEKIVIEKYLKILVN